MRTRDILLVDDDIYYLQLLSIFLIVEGFDVVATSNGINALEILEKENFRMVITDFNMPGMDGLELAAHVRERHPGTPVILVTANAISEVIEESVSAGVSEIFSKPVDIERFLATIRSTLLPSLWDHKIRAIDDTSCASALASEATVCCAQCGAEAHDPLSVCEPVDIQSRK